MCFSGGGGDKNVGKAAKMQAELAKEQLQWFKDEYAATAGDRLATQKRANEVSDFQMGQMRDADVRADDAYAFEQKYTRPIQQRMSSEALNYDTPERREAAARAAAADIQMASSNQQAILGRNLARDGVNPGSGAAYAAQQQNALATAAASAGAQNNARTQVEAVGYGRMADAAGMGAQMASRGAQQSGIAAGAGQGALGAQQSGLAARTSGLGGMNNAYQTASGMMQSSANLYGQNAQLKQQSAAGDAQAIGGLASAAMMAFALSDKTKKKGTGQKADGAAALEQIEQLPVQEGWQYDPAKGGPDDGGQPHTGPMAQDVARVMGQQAAPGGRMLDLVTMSGKTLAAVQELSQRVKRLETTEQA